MIPNWFGESSLGHFPRLKLAFLDRNWAAYNQERAFGTTWLYPQIPQLESTQQEHVHKHTQCHSQWVLCLPWQDEMQHAWLALSPSLLHLTWGSTKCFKAYVTFCKHKNTLSEILELGNKYTVVDIMELLISFKVIMSYWRTWTHIQRALQTRTTAVTSFCRVTLTTIQLHFHHQARAEDGRGEKDQYQNPVSNQMKVEI